MNHILLTAITFISLFNSASWALLPDQYGSGPIIHRSRNGNDYLFSTAGFEGPRAGYSYDEARFGLSPVGTPGTTALFRCRVNVALPQHFLSTDPNCEGQISEGALGSLSVNRAEGLAALNRFVKPSTGAHIVIAEGEAFDLSGWAHEGTMGYVTPLQVPSVTITPDDGRRYFGYFGGAMDGVGTGNYISELVDYSNVIHIHSVMNLDAKLAECQQRGIKAMVSVDWAFIDANFQLRSDYKEVFANVEPILRKYDSIIVALYATDEPYTNSSHKGMGPQEVYYVQETMGRYLKSKFPHKPIAAIMTTDELKLGRPLFPSFDWWGFDCYDKDLKCNDVSVNDFYLKQIGMMNALTAVDSKPRFIISVPQSGIPVKRFLKGSERDIYAQLPYYLSLSVNLPVKLVMPFLWQSFDDGKSKWIGTRELPGVRNTFQTWYRNFTAPR